MAKKKVMIDVRESEERAKIILEKFVAGEDLEAITASCLVPLTRVYSVLRRLKRSVSRAEYDQAVQLRRQRRLGRHGRIDRHREEIQAKYKAGASTTELAEEYRCSVAAIRLKVGAELRAQARKPYRQKPPDPYQEEIRAKRRAGASVRELVKEYKLSPPTIRARIGDELSEEIRVKRRIERHVKRNVEKANKPRPCKPGNSHKVWVAAIKARFLAGECLEVMAKKEHCPIRHLREVLKQELLK